MTQDELFHVEPTHLPGDKDSAGVRRTKRFLERIELGYHPLTGTRLHPDAHRERDGEGPRCGGCQHRIEWAGYPKCEFYKTHSEATDCRAWWPACPQWVARFNVETA